MLREGFIAVSLMIILIALQYASTLFDNSSWYLLLYMGFVWTFYLYIVVYFIMILSKTFKFLMKSKPKGW